MSESASSASGAPRAFFCYLLRSKNPSHPHSTYIGFTVDPLRRLQQHNRERVGGAKSTGRHGPWEMVACVHGFPTKVAALQFEWAWQYPKLSRLLRSIMGPKAAPNRHTRVKGKMTLLYSMLSLPPWRAWSLHVRYLAEDQFVQVHEGALRSHAQCVPPHMSVTVGPLQQLEWFSSTKKSRRRDPHSSDEWDTLGEEPFGLQVARFRKAARGRGGGQAEEEEKQHRRREDDDDDDDEEEEIFDGPYDDEYEAAHDVLDDDLLICSQPVPATSATAVAAISAAHDEAAAALRVDHDTLQEEMDSFGFRYDDLSHSFVLLSDDERSGVMEGGADDEEEIDMTTEDPPATLLIGMASSSSNAVGPTSLRPPKHSSCQICRVVPPVPSSTQITSFGFQNLLSVCSHCSTPAHLLCFQSHMQSKKGPLDSLPLIPEPAPCPFCNAPLVWCHLVENCHRYHAPVAARDGKDARTINEYMEDAAKKFRRVVQARIDEARSRESETRRMRAEQAKHAPPRRKNKKRQSRSLTPTRDLHAHDCASSSAPSAAAAAAVSASAGLAASLPAPQRPARSNSVPDSPNIAASLLAASPPLRPPAKKKRVTKKAAAAAAAAEAALGAPNEAHPASPPRAKNAKPKVRNARTKKTTAPPSIGLISEECEDDLSVTDREDEIDLTQVSDPWDHTVADEAAPAAAAAAAIGRPARSLSQAQASPTRAHRSSFYRSFYSQHDSPSADSISSSPPPLESVRHAAASDAPAASAAAAPLTAIERLKSKYGEQIVLSL